MTTCVAMLHYASPPGVGGVESTIAYHARILSDLGYQVRVVSGSGAVFDERVDIYIHPLFGSKHPQVLAVKQQLDTGTVSPEFEVLVEEQTAALGEVLAGCGVCIVHNIHTLNKNLPLTAALARLESPRLIAWCHDLAWTNQQYLPELHDSYPWDLLRQAWPNTRYVTVSEPRRYELADLLKIAADEITVVVPGIDPARFFHWTETMQMIEARLHLLDAAGILLLPARLTRRKNIALALDVLNEIRRQSGEDFRLVVTGPPGPHNPTNRGHLGELLALRRGLGLDDSAHFLYELSDPPLIPDDDTMANLYQLADALFFPSVQEGFGIPVLEAGLAGIPVFCADIAAFRQTGQEDVMYFDPLRDLAKGIAGRVVDTLNAHAPYRLRTRVRREYRWDTIIREHIIPLLEG